MFYNGIPQQYLEDITVFNNNTYGGNFGFSGFSSLDPSNVAGTSQTYTGADDPDFPTPSTALTSIDPFNGLDPQEGKSRHTSMTAIQSLTL